MLLSHDFSCFKGLIQIQKLCELSIYILWVLTLFSLECHITIGLAPLLTTIQPQFSAPINHPLLPNLATTFQLHNHQSQLQTTATTKFSGKLSTTQPWSPFLRLPLSSPPRSRIHHSSSSSNNCTVALWHFQPHLHETPPLFLL